MGSFMVENVSMGFFWVLILDQEGREGGGELLEAIGLGIFWGFYFSPHSHISVTPIPGLQKMVLTKVSLK